MSRSQILERERRWAVPVGAAAIAIVPLYILSTYLEGSTSIFDFDLATERLRAVDADSGQIIGASVLRALSFLLYLPPLLYLFRAAQARSPRVSGAMIGFVFIGPILFATWVLLSNLAQVQIASDFIAGAVPGGDIYNLLDDLIEDSTLATVGGNLFFPAVLGVLVAMIYVPLQAMRVGLLTRFFATLGMALGVSLLLIQPQISLLVVSIWFAWLGFLILGRTPKGRPPAWAAGEAVPWPSPGERVEQAGTGDEPAAEVVEGDAAEVFEPQSKDHSARRERARKKKRKRRG